MKNEDVLVVVDYALARGLEFSNDVDVGLGLVADGSVDPISS